MADERPRPQYGEYAPEGWVSPHYPPPEAPAVEVAPVAAEAPPVKRRTWDRVLTFGLLGIGLYFVLSGFISFSRLPEVFDQMFAQLGIGDFTSDSAATTVGIIANVVQPVIWAIAAFGASVWLRRGRIAFWWPLAGGVLANLIVVILVGVVMALDPAYAEYVAQLSQ